MRLKSDLCANLAHTDRHERTCQMIEAAERFQAIENVNQNGSLVHKILRHNANIYHIRESPRHQTPYQLPMTKSNAPGGLPCNGAASGAARGRPCVLSSIAQAADTRADSLVPF